MIDTERLADILVEVADTLVADFDLMEFLHLVATHAAEVGDGALVGIVLADEQQRLHHMGASHENARSLELMQLLQHQGPCLDCYASGEPVVVLDLASASDRWPAFAPAAVASGVRSVHALPMRLRDEVIGALNVFGERGEVLTPDGMRVVQALADVATIALIQQRVIARGELVREQLQVALDSRVAIEQAKGAVARTLGVTVDQAFELMRRRARRDRVPLTELARRLLDAPTSISDLVTGVPVEPT